MRANSLRFSVCLALLCLLFPSLVQASTQAQIDHAINAGLAWLVSQQRADGSWAYTPTCGAYCDEATTALVLLKLVERAKELGKDPFDGDPASPTYYPYAPNVTAGFDYVFGSASVNAAGVNFYDTVYGTGITMMAVGNTTAPNRLIATGPLAGRTYRQALQGMMDWIADAQNDYDCGVGGWGYSPNMQSWADNSNSGYATLGVGFAGDPRGFAISIPASVFAGLDAFVDNVQASGGPYSGGSLYNPCWGSSPSWYNTLKTGNLLYEMALLGRAPSDPTVRNAIGFIQNFWSSPACNFAEGCGWQGDYQAMFILMKGLWAYKVTYLTISGSPVDWFDVVTTYVVDHQNPDGSWDHDASLNLEDTNDVIDTAWALLTMERVTKPQFFIPDQCVPAGQSFTCFDADSYVLRGMPPFTWTWSGNVALTLTKDSDNNICIAYPPGWTGVETVTLTLTDANGTIVDQNVTFTVSPVPAIAPIPEQFSPFPPFDLDSYLSGIDPSEVIWSFSGNVCLQVSIDPAHVVTVTNPGGACTNPEVIRFTAVAPLSECRQNASVDVRFSTCPIPSVQILEPTHDELGLPPVSIPIYVRFQTDGGAPIVREMLYLMDGCVLYDGNVFGDRDGVLADEFPLLINKYKLCQAMAACGYTTLSRPKIRVAATNACGRTAYAERIIRLRLLKTEVCAR